MHIYLADNYIFKLIDDVKQYDFINIFGSSKVIVPYISNMCVDCIYAYCSLLFMI